MRKDDVVGRILGILIFLGGIGLLAFVFATAYGWFSSPTAGLPIAPTKGTTTPATTQLGQSALTLLIRIGLLIVMTIVGSMLAGRGIQLYFAATNAAKHPAMYPSEEEG